MSDGLNFWIQVDIHTLTATKIKKINLTSGTIQRAQKKGYEIKQDFVGATWTE